MASPLIHRLPRELTGNLGRYVGIFLLIAVAISFVTGFLVAASSIERIIAEMPETYHMQDGQFTTAFEAPEAALDEVEALGVSVEPEFSRDVTVTFTEADAAESRTEEATARVFEERTRFDIAAYAEGHAPETDDQIALDRVFCAHHALEVGDEVRIGDAEFQISGICTLPDYSALFEDPGDFVFNALTFTVAQVTPGAFEGLGGSIVCTYAYQADEDLTRTQQADLAEDIVHALTDAGVMVTSVLTADANSAISYAGDDVEGDQLMWEVMLVLIIVIMAFVFVVLTGANIESESAIIGTLLASGYRKRELVAHYLALPALVGFAAAIVGNVAGYTWLSAPMQGLYYNSYSLPPYEAFWNGRVFVITTVVPLVLLIGVTFAGMVWKLRATPLEFLRHETTRRSRRRGVTLPERLSFTTRFRLRIFLCNFSSFLTLFAGIVFASLLLVFGLCMMPVIQNYADNLKSDLVSDHQYVLKVPVELDANDAAADQAEHFAAASLETARPLGDDAEPVTVYGLQPDSAYWKDVDVSQGRVVIGRGLAEKCGIAVGDVRTFDDPTSDETYDLPIAGVTGSSSNMNAYMSLEEFNRLFGNEEGFFNGYVSDEELALDEAYVMSDLTPAEMDKIVAQMTDSMGSMTSMLTVLAAIIYVVLMYLLTKTVIDRSARSISYMKVFGYRAGEIDALYIRSITVCVVVSLIASLPIIIAFLTWLVKVVFMEYSGNFEVVVPPAQMAFAVGVGLLCYAVVAVLHVTRIERVPLSVALKVQE